MSFINERFMLKNETAFELYNQVKDLPIFDFHCHLSPKEIAENKPFDNITQIWLNGDHYKWRAMRANGIQEEYITGEKSDYEKFEAWAKTLDNCIINPLYHWCALELKRYFDIEELLGENNAKEIWEKANKVIKGEQYTPKKIIGMSNVDTVCTTDGPLDDLRWHKEIKKDKEFKTKVIPGFRPDELFAIGKEKFTTFIKKFEKLMNKEMLTYKDMMESIYNRIEFFNENGCFVSDHGLVSLVYLEATDEEINKIYFKGKNGESVTKEESEKFITRVLIDLSKEYKKYDWVMQIHFGAIRNNNSKMFRKLGVDSGFDSMIDTNDVAIKLNALLDRFSENGTLPKMIIFNLEPSINNVIACTIANFQNDFGKMQFGAGWWFNDTKEGMLRQMKTLADQGLLSKFVGMLTDSRSLFSYIRHEYFRRILCDYIGELVESGEIPNNKDLLNKFVKNISYYNAKTYFKKKGE